jgi:ARG and Rhodanese-Phosphatase-superfamily-associated Protein domain
MRSKTKRAVAIVFAAILILGGAAILKPDWGPDTRVAAAPGGGPAEPWGLGAPVTYQDLTIFPVISSQNPDTSDFETLDQALSAGDAVISEQGGYMRRTRDGEPVPIYTGGSQVNQLVLVNRGKRPLLLLAGEVVSGGKQDRIIGKDRIVPIGAAPLPLDVFCVEHGRWTGDSMNFSAAETMVHPTVREQAAVKQDQNQVWAAVRDETPKVGEESESVTAEGQPSTLGLRARNYQALTVPPALPQAAIGGVIQGAPSQSYRRIYQSPMVQNSVEGFADEMSRRFDRATSGIKGGHVVGVVVAFGDHVAWSDVFASSQLFETYWPKLLRSYVVEALTRPAVRQAATIDDARDFLRPATGRIQEDTEPGVYTWREQSVDGLTQIELEALAPRPITLHWLRVAR